MIYEFFRKCLWSCLLLGTATLGSCATPEAVGSIGTGASIGRFDGDLIVKVMDDGRRMRLAAPFEYIDSKKRRWVVPKGEVVDGASIPESLWSLIGGPFSGRYRKASVIHDFYCDYRVRSTSDVHNVFFDAMRASGVGVQKAKMMFFAVLRFGPSWNGVNRKDLCAGKHKPEDLGLSAEEISACSVATRGGYTAAPARTSKYNAKDFREAQKAIEAGNMSLDQLRALAVSQRQQ